jgi:Flp pilus assembly protein TadG
MALSPSHHPVRRAAIAPLTAILLIPLLGLVAFAVDLGWIVLTQSDLQNAADSAALAGAGQMMNGFVMYNLPNQSSNQLSILNTAESGAKSWAKKFAGLNTAGGVSSLTLLDSDIQFGFTDANGAYTAYASGSPYPNTIKVTMRRDSTANTALALFFGPVLGLPTVDLNATSSATIYAANVNSFANTSSLAVGMLPMTYDVNNWNSFLATGLAPGASTVTLDALGNPDIQIYPSLKDTGNFGLLGLDDSHAGASTVSSWITSGLTQADLQNLLSNSASAQTPLIPLSQHNQNILPSASTDGLGSWNWVGDTGMKTSVEHTLSNYVGNTYLLPLFKPLNSSDANYTAGIGNGSHYDYNIVQFVSVQLISANGGVIVQPSAMVLNPSWVIMSSVVPAGTGTGASSTTNATTFAPPKLTQ